MPKDRTDVDDPVLAAELDPELDPAGPPDLDGWFRELADAMAPLDAMGATSLVVEPRSGRILGTTGSTQRVLGGATPANVWDLVDLGLLSRPDLERLIGWIRDRRRVDDRDRPKEETTHTLTDLVRLHLADQPMVAMEVSLLYHRRPRLGAEAVTVSIRPLDQHELLEHEQDLHLPHEVWTLYDEELRVLATDPRLADIGIDPQSQVGALAAALTHPEDLPGVLDVVLDMIGGTTRSAHIQIRVPTIEGRWHPASVELRRLARGDSFYVLGIARPQRHGLRGRTAIPPGLLTARQQQVVAALFDGLRVREIAARDQVSERTIRNQLAAVYRKLDVAGQADLLANHLRPSGH